MEPFPNHKRKVVKLNIYEDSIDKLIHSLHLLRHKLSNGHHINPSIINDVVEICLEPEWNRTQAIRSFHIYTRKTGVDYFKTCRGYYFDKPKKRRDLEGLLESALDTIDYNYFVNYREHQKAIIINLLQAIDKYLEGYLSEKDYGPYKRAVVVGFICAQMGMFKKKEQFDDADYNAYLFDKIKGIQKSYRASQKKVLLISKK